jgi:hypothetical protein
LQIIQYYDAILVKGPVTLPTVVVLGQKVRSNLVSIVQFFVLIPNLASDLPYVAYFGGKSTSKFSLPALFERLAFRL